MHGQHVFDVNCRICTGTAAADSAAVKRSKSRNTSGTRSGNCSVVAEKESCVEKLDKVQRQKSAIEISDNDEVADLVEVFPKSSAKPESAPNRDDAPSWLNVPPPVIIPKNSPNPDSDLTDPRDRTRVIPRNSSLCRIKQYSTSSLSSEVDASSGSSLVASEQPRDVEP